MQVERGLVDEEELTVDRRLSKILLELHPSLYRAVHLRLEHDEVVPVIALGAVQRHIRVAQQLLDGYPLAARDPDAGRDRQSRLLAVCQRERLTQGSLETFGDDLRAGRERQLVDDQEKLVAADASHGVAFAHHLA